MSNYLKATHSKIVAISKEKEEKRLLTERKDTLLCKMTAHFTKIAF